MWNIPVVRHFGSVSPHYPAPPLLFPFVTPSCFQLGSLHLSGLFCLSACRRVMLSRRLVTVFITKRERERVEKKSVWFLMAPIWIFKDERRQRENLSRSFKLDISVFFLSCRLKKSVYPIFISLEAHIFKWKIVVLVFPPFPHLLFNVINTNFHVGNKLYFAKGLKIAINKYFSHRSPQGFTF